MRFAANRVALCRKMHGDLPQNGGLFCGKTVPHFAAKQKTGAAPIAVNLSVVAAFLTFLV
jgi:hypothetical protein